MDYIKGLESWTCVDDTAVTLGKFDGLHRGHQKLIRRVQQLKEMHKVVSVVCAFDMSPLFAKKGIQKMEIMSTKERIAHLEHEVDILVDCPFTDQVCNMEAEDFIKDILVQKFHAKYIVVGTDFHFGHEKRGDVQMLRKYAETYGYELFVEEKESYHGREISSTFIKEELQKGNMEAVNEMLGYPYSISGTVEKGMQLARKLGFPTMNVQPDANKLLPPNGVYLVRVDVDGACHLGIANIGVKPTVTAEKRTLIESFLFDFSENAYEKEVTTALMHFKRPEQKFENVEAMKAQVDQDISYAKTFFEMQ